MTSLPRNETILGAVIVPTSPTGVWSVPRIKPSGGPSISRETISCRHYGRPSTPCIGPLRIKPRSGRLQSKYTAQSCDRSGLDLNHDAWLKEMCNPEEGAYRLTSCTRKDRHQLAGLCHESVYICSVEVQSHDVLWFHVRGGEDLDQILPRKLELRGEITRMHGCAVRVVRSLAGDIERPLSSCYLDRLIDVERSKPSLGINRTNLHVKYLRWYELNRIISLPGLWQASETKEERVHGL